CRARALRSEPGVLQAERQFPIPPLKPGLIGPGDLREHAAPRLLLAEDDAAIDDLARPRVAHPLQGDLQPESSPLLDLAVADMPRAVDPPRDGRDPDGWHQRQREQ